MGYELQVELICDRSSSIPMTSLTVACTSEAERTTLLAFFENRCYGRVPQDKAGRGERAADGAVAYVNWHYLRIGGKDSAEDWQRRLIRILHCGEVSIYRADMCFLHVLKGARVCSDSDDPYFWLLPADSSSQPVLAMCARASVARFWVNIISKLHAQPSTIEAYLGSPPSRLCHNPLLQALCARNDFLTFRQRFLASHLWQCPSMLTYGFLDGSFSSAQPNNNALSPSLSHAHSSSATSGPNSNNIPSSQKQSPRVSAKRSVIRGLRGLDQDDDTCDDSLTMKPIQYLLNTLRTTSEATVAVGGQGKEGKELSSRSRFKRQPTKKEGRARQIYRAKVVVLGEKGVGKSSVISLLGKRRYRTVVGKMVVQGGDGDVHDAEVLSMMTDDGELDQEEDLRDEDLVELSYLSIRSPILPSREGRLQCAVWDCPAASHIRVSHDVLGTRDSIYLVVFDLRGVVTDRMALEQRVAQWVRLAAQHGNDSPIVLVGTHLDLLEDPDTRLAEIQKSLAQQLLPIATVADFYCVRAKSRKDLQPLVDCMVRLSLGLAHNPQEVPAEYITFEKRVLHQCGFRHTEEGQGSSGSAVLSSAAAPPELRGLQLFPRSHFEAVARECKLPVEVFSAALGMLRAAGIIYWFDDVDPDTILAGPGVVVRSVVLLLKNGVEYSESGLIGKDHVNAVLVEYGRATRDYIVRLFISRGVLRGGMEKELRFFCHSLLPPQPITRTSQFVLSRLRQDCEVFGRHFQGTFPPSLMSDLLLRTLHFSLGAQEMWDVHSYWSNGLVLQLRSRDVVTLIAHAADDLCLYVMGADCAADFSWFVRNLDTVMNESYMLKQVSTLIPCLQCLRYLVDRAHASEPGTPTGTRPPLQQMQESGGSSPLPVHTPDSPAFKKERGSGSRPPRPCLDRSNFLAWVSTGDLLLDTSSTSSPCSSSATDRLSTGSDNTVASPASVDNVFLDGSTICFVGAFLPSLHSVLAATEMSITTGQVSMLSYDAVLTAFADKGAGFVGCGEGHRVDLADVVPELVASQIVRGAECDVSVEAASASGMGEEIFSSGAVTVYKGQWREQEVATKLWKEEEEFERADIYLEFAHELTALVVLQHPHIGMCLC